MSFFSRIFKRGEKLFLGEVIRDYGVLDERKSGITTFKVSILLCEKNGNRVLISKQSARALLGSSVSYHYIYEENLPALKQAVDDVIELIQK